MSLEHLNELYVSEIKNGNYILKVKTFELIAAGFDVFHSLETSVFLKECAGYCPPIEEFAKNHKVILYSEHKDFKDDRDALYASAEKFHEEQIENIKKLPFDKLRICSQFAVKDKLNEMEGQTPRDSS